MLSQGHSKSHFPSSVNAGRSPGGGHEIPFGTIQSICTPVNGFDWQ